MEFDFSVSRLAAWRRLVSLSRSSFCDVRQFVDSGAFRSFVLVKPDSLLGRFYVERYRDKSLWNCRLEWVIVPNQERLAEIPEADADFFCGIETGEKITYAEGEDQIIGTELKRRAKAENQAKALCDLIYPGFENRQGWYPHDDSSLDDDSLD